MFSRLWRVARGEGGGNDYGDGAPSPGGNDAGISAVSSFSSSSSDSSEGDVEDFLNFEATLAEQGLGSNNRAVVADQDIDDPETIHNARLAAAWFQKRSLLTTPIYSSTTYSSPSPTHLYSGSLVRTGGLQLSIPEDGPIDLDEAMQQMDEEDDEEELEEECERCFDTVSYAHHIERMARPLESSESCSSDSSQDAVDGRCLHRSSSAIPSLTLFATDSSLLAESRLGHHAEFDRISMISAATSDMTPVVCNRTESPKTSRRKQLDGIDESGSGGTGGWKQYCDCATYQGKIALLLGAILVLSLVTIVVSSTQVKNREGEESAIPGPPDSATNATSWAPAPVPVPGPAAASLVPTPKPVPQTSSPTSASSVPFDKLEWGPMGTRIEGGSGTDAFGSALALSSDASVLAVGSRDAATNGAAGAGMVQLYAFDSETLSWSRVIGSQQGRSSQDGMGAAIAVSDDGSVVVVGEPGNDLAGDRAGSVRTLLYDKKEGTISEAPPLFGPGPVSYFGVAVSLAGTRLVVGASAASSTTERMAGLVQLYELDSERLAWGVKETFTGTDDFDWLGSAVDISEDGKVVVASAPQNSDVKGYVRVWRINDEQQWVPHTDITNSISPAKGDDRFGHALSVSYTGDDVYRVAIGSPYKNKNPSDQNSGVVLVYELSFSTESVKTSLIGEMSGDNGDELGYSVKLQQGRFLAVGCPGWNDRQGLVNLYYYDEEKEEWEGTGSKFEGTAEGDEFGSALSLLRTDRLTMLVVGATVASTGNGTTYVSCFGPT